MSTENVSPSPAKTPALTSRDWGIAAAVVAVVAGFTIGWFVGKDSADAQVKPRLACVNQQAYLLLPNEDRFDGFPWYEMNTECSLLPSTSPPFSPPISPLPEPQPPYYWERPGMRLLPEESAPPATTNPANPGVPLDGKESPELTPTPAFVDDVVGMPERKAQTVVENNGWSWRVVERDGQMEAVTADYNPTRVSATIVEGVVTETRVG